MKWWWEIYFWGNGTMIVIAYVCYKRFMNTEGRKPFSPYEFQKQLILAKMCLVSLVLTTKSVKCFQQEDHRSHKKKHSRLLFLHGAQEAPLLSPVQRSRRLHLLQKKAEYATVGKFCNKKSDFNAKSLNSVVHHLPEPSIRQSTGGQCCSLCKWATGRKYSSQLLK